MRLYSFLLHLPSAVSGLSCAGDLLEKAVLADNFLAGFSQGPSTHCNVHEKGDLEIPTKAV